MEEARELLVQCLHSHSHANHTLDSLNIVDRPSQIEVPKRRPHLYPTLVLDTLVTDDNERLGAECSPPLTRDGQCSALFDPLSTKFASLWPL